MPRAVEHYFNAVVLDKNDDEFAFIAVTEKSYGEQWDGFIQDQWAKLHEPVDFAFGVDLEWIRLYRASGGGPESIACLETKQMLTRYDPAFSERRIFQHYLLTLVEAWLRDLAYNWKSEIPPGMEELRSTGLLERLKGGTTRPLRD